MVLPPCFIDRRFQQLGEIGGRHLLSGVYFSGHLNQSPTFRLSCKASTYKWMNGSVGFVFMGVAVFDESGVKVGVALGFVRVFVDQVDGMALNFVDSLDFVVGPILSSINLANEQA